MDNWIDIAVGKPEVGGYSDGEVGTRTQARSRSANVTPREDWLRMNSGAEYRMTGQTYPDGFEFP
jgi:hypothetical protein